MNKEDIPIVFAILIKLEIITIVVEYIATTLHISFDLRIPFTTLIQSIIAFVSDTDANIDDNGRFTIISGIILELTNFICSHPHKIEIMKILNSTSLIKRIEEGKEQGGEDQGGEDQGGKDQGGKDQGGKYQGGEEQGGKYQGGEEQGGEGQEAINNNIAYTVYALLRILPNFKRYNFVQLLVFVHDCYTNNMNYIAAEILDVIDPFMILDTATAIIPIPVAEIASRGIIQLSDIEIFILQNALKRIDYANAGNIQKLILIMGRCMQSPYNGQTICLRPSHFINIILKIASNTDTIYHNIILIIISEDKELMFLIKIVSHLLLLDEDSIVQLQLVNVAIKFQKKLLSMGYKKQVSGDEFDKQKHLFDKLKNQASRLSAGCYNMLLKNNIFQTHTLLLYSAKKSKVMGKGKKENSKEIVAPTEQAIKDSENALLSLLKEEEEAANKKATKKLTAENLASKKLAAKEKLAAEKLAAKELAAAELAVEQKLIAEQKLTAKELVAEELAATKLAAAELAAAELAAAELTATKLAAVELAATELAAAELAAAELAAVELAAVEKKKLKAAKKKLAKEKKLVEELTAAKLAADEKLAAADEKLVAAVELVEEEKIAEDVTAEEATKAKEDATAEANLLELINIVPVFDCFSNAYIFDIGIYYNTTNQLIYYNNNGIFANIMPGQEVPELFMYRDGFIYYNKVVAENGACWEILLC